MVYFDLSTQISFNTIVETSIFMLVTLDALRKANEEVLESADYSNK
jgi:hypothetical protein